MSKYKLTNLGSKVIKKGEARNVLPRIMKESLLLEDAIGLGNKSDLLVLGIRQNGTNYYTVGTINNANQPTESVSFRNGKDNGQLCDINNVKLPYLANASELLLQNFKEAGNHLYCDRLIADDIQNHSIEEVNGYLMFCEKCGLIEPSNVESPSEDEIVTMQSLEEYSKTNSLFDFKNEEVTASDILKDLNINIAQIDIRQTMESMQIQQDLQQHQEAEASRETISPTAP